jgi:hypothetical protein
MDNFDKNEVLLAFKHRARAFQITVSAQGYAQRLLNEKPWTSRSRRSFEEYRQDPSSSALRLDRARTLLHASTKARARLYRWQNHSALPIRSRSMWSKRRARTSVARAGVGLDARAAAGRARNYAACVLTPDRKPWRSHCYSLGGSAQRPFGQALGAPPSITRKAA